MQSPFPATPTSLDMPGLQGMQVSMENFLYGLSFDLQEQLYSPGSMQAQACSPMMQDVSSPYPQQSPQQLMRDELQPARTPSPFSTPEHFPQLQASPMSLQHTSPPPFECKPAWGGAKVGCWLSSKELALGVDESSSDTPTEPEGEYSPAGSSGFNPFELPLELLSPVSLHGTVEQLCALHVTSALDLEQLSQALFLKACSEPSVMPGLVSDLVACLLPRLPSFFETHRRESLSDSCVSLLTTLAEACSEDFVGIETETPSEHSHGNVLFCGELYKRGLLGMGHVKAMFGQLLFAQQPLDHAASLACHLYLTVGPCLERTKVGRKLLDYVTMRMKELKGGNYSSPTRFSLGHVTDLRSTGWVSRKPKEGKKEEKKEEPKEEPKEEQKEAPARSYEDKVLTVGALFVQQRVQMPVVKELFSQLLFAPAPADGQVSLAASLLAVVGPTLDCSEVGTTLADYVLLRFREVQKQSSAATKAAIQEVTKARSCLWSKPKPKAQDRAFTFSVG